MKEYVEKAVVLSYPIRADHCDKENANEHFIFGIESVMEYVENLPAADVAEVVRCRECKHYKPEEYFSPCVLPQGLECAKPDDYCSYGQRKEDNHEQ